MATSMSIELAQFPFDPNRSQGSLKEALYLLGETRNRQGSFCTGKVAVHEARFNTTGAWRLWPEMRNRSVFEVESQNEDSVLMLNSRLVEHLPGRNAEVYRHFTGRNGQP